MLKVLISIDRYLSIRVKGWRTNYLKSDRALLVALLLGAFVFVFNHHLLYLHGIVVDGNNGTSQILCYYSTFLDGHYIPTWHFVRVFRVFSGRNAKMRGFCCSFYSSFKVHIFVYSLVPFLVLVAVNSMLIFRALTSGPKSLAFSQSSSSSRNARKRTLTSTIVSLTIMFIVTSLPYTLAAAIWYRKVYAYPLGKLLLNSLSLLSFSYHSFNFFVLFCTNKLFLSECRLIFSWLLLRRTRYELRNQSSTN